MSKKPTEQDQLRKASEAALSAAPKTKSRHAGELLHELQVHKVELEMQNEQLRQAQVELEISRDRFADLYDFAPVGYLTLNREGMIEEVNLTAAALLGIDRNKLPLQRFASFVAKEDMDHWHHHILNVQKCNDTQTCELALKRGDGSYFHAQLDCLCLKQGDDKPVVRIAFVDVTRRNAIGEALMESKRFFSTLTQVSPVGIYRTDAQGNGLYSNERCQEIAGLTAVEVLGSGWLQAIHPDDREKVEKAWYISLRDHQNFNMEYRIQRPNGVTRWVLGQAAAERDAAGEVAGYVGTLTDITEVKQAAIRQAELLSLLHATLESTADAILVVDLNNKWVLHNQKFVDLWHITDEITVSRDDKAALLYVLNQLEDPDGFLNKVRELYATPEASSFDTFELKNGKVIERYSIPQRIEGKVAGRVWSFRDITERILAEKALTKQQHLSDEIISSLPGIFYMLDQQGCFVRVNPQFLEVSGYSSKELESISALSFFEGNDKEVIAQKMQEVFETGDSWAEAEFITKFGQGIPYYFSGHRTNIDGKLYIVGLGINIAERKAIESQLLESELQYRTLADSGQALIWASGADKLCDYFNKVWLDFTGRSMEQELGNGWAEGVHPDDFQHCLDVYMSAFDRREKFSMDYRLRRNDGEYRWIQDDGCPRYNSKGDFIGYIGHCLDITERKLAEIKAAALIHRNAVFMQSTPECIHILNDQGKVLEVNGAFCRHLGYTEDEALQLSVPDFDAKFAADEVRTVIAKLWGNHTTFESIHRRKDGTLVDVEITVSGVELDGQKCLFALARDISERKRAEEEIKSLAFYDTLTHLPNRRLLMDRLKQALASSARSGREGALLFIDLDKFKTLNDSLGHKTGDLLLQQVAQRLECCIREGDTVARLGGDEFVVMLEDLSEQDIEAAAQAEAVGDKILSTLNQPYQLETHVHHSTPSIGVTLFSGSRQSQDELLQQADIAMYQAKKAGRNVLRFFDPTMQAIITARAIQETDLRRAVAELDQFQLYYQAQIDSSGRLIGAEALVRWQHPTHGMMHPGEFIPLAEETGLILPLGHWVLTTACRQLVAWAEQPETAHLTLAVNISAKQLHLTTFVEEVLALVDHFGVDPTKLKLEITESMLLGDVDDTIANMTVLKARGISFSMDDFGTGYSSLQYLKRLPLDQLKIDQSFVHDIATDDSDKTIVRTIIAMAQGLNLNVIAEGVETAAQRQLLLDRGCTVFQGYLLGRPIPIEEFESLMRELPASGNKLP